MIFVQGTAQRLALAAWWESQPTKREKAFAETAALARRVPPSPPARIVGQLFGKKFCFGKLTLP